MTELDDKCLFYKLYECEEKDNSSEAGPQRIKSIISASKIYGNELHVELEKQYENNENLSVQVHKKCVDKYCHKKTLERVKQREKRNFPSPSPENLPTATKRLRRSEARQFVFLEHCLFCGNI